MSSGDGAGAVAAAAAADVAILSSNQGRPDVLLDVNGRNLVRRINWATCAGFLGVFVTLVTLILIAVVLHKLNTQDYAAAQAIKTWQALESTLKTSGFSRLLMLGGGTGISSSAVADLYTCKSGLALPRHIVVLGEGELSGGSLRVDSVASWTRKLLALGGSALANTDVLYLNANVSTYSAGPYVLEQQLQQLSASLDASLWLASRDPTLIVVQYGYVELLAALAKFSDAYVDARSGVSFHQLISQIGAVLNSDLAMQTQNRVLFLLDSPAYWPVANNQLDPSVHVCTDPLAYQMYQNARSSVSTLLTDTIQSTLADAIAVQVARYNPKATVEVLPLGPLFERFTWSNGAVSTAFDDDCITINADGENLLAQYLLACLNGDAFDIPPRI